VGHRGGVGTPQPVPVTVRPGQALVPSQSGMHAVDQSHLPPSQRVTGVCVTAKGDRGAASGDFMSRCMARARRVATTSGLRLASLRLPLGPVITPRPPCTRVCDWWQILPPGTVSRRIR
jgi:hypothetical protein